MQKKKDADLDERSRQIIEFMKTHKSEIHDLKSEGCKKRPRDYLHVEKEDSKDSLTK